MMNKWIKYLTIMLVDCGIVFVSTMVPLIIRFGIFDVDNVYVNKALGLMPLFMAIAIIVMVLFKLYNRVWTFAGMAEMGAVFSATVVIEALYIILTLATGNRMPLTWYVMLFFLLLFFFGASRISVRIVRKAKRPKHKDARNTIIIGAGSAGNIITREIASANILKKPVKLVGFIDDNPHKRGSMVNGLPVLGKRKDIPGIVKKYDVQVIILAIPSASSAIIKETIEICNETDAIIKILPGIVTSMKDSFANELRDINYEDLLGRASTHVDMSGSGNIIKGRTILVTGGAGSIGSELCRQIALFQPDRLIIFDVNENSLYVLELELKRRFPDIEIFALIGSVRDRCRVDEVMEAYRPSIIFHAAAHKHVPLMEESPKEAIKNNIFGTFNVAESAGEYEVDKMILISTDKAVNPTSIMGASKRVCEMVIQTMDGRYKKTTYAAVRFGNVLGSNGSVIPLFKEQIQRGGPVTVTHPEVTRYFMTISEAVSLVLQAGCYAANGEIFILDMGTPVKIADMARNLIKLEGYKPDEDISIEYIGLRPGEKLYEEVLMDEEGLKDTANDMIKIGRKLDFDKDELMSTLDSMDRLHSMIENCREQ